MGSQDVADRVCREERIVRCKTLFSLMSSSALEIVKCSQR